MDQFELLKQDLATLISTATSTVQQLVDKMATAAQGAMTGNVDPGITANSFLSDIATMRQQVQDATAALQSKANTILQGTAGGTPAPVVQPAPVVTDPASVVQPPAPAAAAVPGAFDPAQFKAGA